MEEKKYIVYLHVNKINGKVYVGITSMEPELRWRDGKGYNSCEIMCRAINKYGWNNFDHIILCKTLKDRAILLEKTLIAYYKRKGISYNISGGGEGAGVMSESTKDKLRQYKGERASMWSRKIPKEVIAKRIATRRAKDNYDRDMPWLAKYRLRKGKDSPMYGRKPSEATLKAHRKVILQYTKDNILIREFESIKQAAITVGVSSPAIVHSLKGIRKTAAGYIWKYKEDIA